MGTAEFYRVVESLDFVADSLVVETTDGAERGTLWLFVVLTQGATLDESTTSRLRSALSTRLSPRHVPDEIRAVTAIPRTLSGKKLEVPVKRILMGTPIEKAANPGTLQNPQALADLLRAAKAGLES